MRAKGEGKSACLEVLVWVLDGGTAADRAPDEGVTIAEGVGHFIGVHAFDGDVHGAVGVKVAAVDLFVFVMCVFVYVCD